MAGLRKLFFQRRQGRTGLGELGLLGKDVGAGNSSEPELLFHQGQLLLFRRHDFPDRPDLGAERPLLHRRGDQVGGEGEPGAFHLETLEIDLRAQSLQLAPRAAEQIERVRNVYRCVVESERRDRVHRLADRGARDLLPPGRGIPLDARK